MEGRIIANYVKSTNFYIKDSLLTGNPAKIIKGAEIDAEYNAIATAVNSKADINSPAFSGIPTSPTASTGNNSLQLATTAFVANSLGTLGTISTQNSDAITITGGTITGITDLTVADGGTGSSTLTLNNVLLGNGASPLQAVAPSTIGNVLTSDGITWVSQALNFTKSLTANGYQKLPSGLIMQWGTTASIGTDSSLAITFPIAYPTACLTVQVTGKLGSITGGQAYSLGTGTTTTTGFTIYNDSSAMPTTWFSVGY